MRFLLIAAALAAALPVHAFDGPEIYPGERVLYEQASREGLVVSSNTSPGWANFAAVFRAFGQRYPNVTLVYNDVGSGAVVQALDKGRGKPVVDTVYYFGISAVDASTRGVLAAYKPVGFEKLPAGMRDPEALWFAVHHMPIAFLVNKKLVKTVPRNWADLKKPEYKQTVVYPDPRTSGAGLVMALAANIAAGGSLDTVQPGIDLLAELHRVGNVLRVEGGTPYARFVRGEIPIWIEFESNGLRAKFIDGMGDDVEVVLPGDGSVAAPYAMSLVKGARDENAARLWLNYVLSEPGQRAFAEGFVRPVVPGLALPPEVAAKMPPATKVEFLDLGRMNLRKPDVDRGWARAVLGSDR